MKYITLSSNHEMPIIGLGTWQSPPDEMQKIVESALSCGYRHFDTAFNYNTEESLGKTLREWINNGSCTREDLFVVTKLPNFANRPEDVPKYFNLSLQRLKLDYVDLYLIHMPFGFVADNTGEAPAKDEDGNFLLDKATDHTSIWKAMEELVDTGKCKSIGVSNFNIAQLESLLSIARIPPAVLQVEMHVYLQQPALKKFCESHNIAITAYSPLGSPGALAHYKKKYNYSPDHFPDLLGHPTVVELGSKYGKTPSQILLRFLVQQNVIVIPKSSNPTRIRENCEIFDFQLSSEDLEQLRSLDQGEKGRIVTFLFFKGVQKHPEYPFAVEGH